MPEYNARYHAYMIGSFYRELRDAFKDRGVAVFLRAANIYGEERGARMAMKALRDGQQLNLHTYNKYIELDMDGGACNIAKYMQDGVFISEHTKCAWLEVFREMDLMDCAYPYCSLIDKAIVRGFNFEKHVELETMLHDGDRCKFLFFMDENDEGFKDIPPKGPITYPWDYQCAHLLFTFQRTIAGVFGEDGGGVIRAARKLIADKYGLDFLDHLEKFKNEQFHFLPAG